MVLTTECVINDIKDNSGGGDHHMPPMGGGMPGMM